MHLESALERLARGQHWVVERSQLVALGWSRRAIEHRLANGQLRRLHRGVYLVGHAQPPRLARERAALLACGEDTVLSHHTAAALWRLRATLPPTVDVMVAGRNPGSRPGVRVHRIRSLDAGDITRRHGCESPPPRARSSTSPLSSHPGTSSKRSTRRARSA